MSKETDQQVDNFVEGAASVTQAIDELAKAFRHVSQVAAPFVKDILAIMHEEKMRRRKIKVLRNKRLTLGLTYWEKRRLYRLTHTNHK